MLSNERDRPLYSLTNIAKTYVPTQGPVVTIPTLEIPRGQIVALIGYSGSGKTTLLNLLAMLETPDQSGSFGVGGASLLFAASQDAESEELLAISDHRRQALRATFGFVFQQGYLLENLTCGNNIKVPFHIRKLDSSKSGIGRLMQNVGLQEAMSDRQPSELSGGERQRISVLRALAHNPSVVFADEATSNLDEDNAAIVLDGLRSWQCGGPDRTVLFVTHNIGQAARYADSVVLMAPGRVLGPIPNASPGGGRMTPAQLSGKLAEFAEHRESTHRPVGELVRPYLAIRQPSPVRRPLADSCRFVLSFALADVFPRVSVKARKGLFQKIFRRRNAQFHSMASMFFALLLAMFFASLYSTLTGQFRSLVQDRRIARIEVLGRRDGERLLSQKDVEELSGLAWAIGPSFDQISLPEEMKAKQLHKVRPAVEAAVGYRVREMRLARNPANVGLSFSTESSLSVVSTRVSDPILRKIELLTGDRIEQLTGGEKSLNSVLSNPANQLGIVCTKSALLQLGYSQVPRMIGLFQPYSSATTPRMLPLVAVVDWLPKSADILITEDLFQQLFYQMGSGDALPRFESVDLYFEDMMKDGVGLYEALQRLGYSAASDRLGFLKWVVALVRAIRYFSLVAGAGIFLVVLITLIVSYTEAIRRKEKEIGVLLAYGTPMSVLYAVFLTEVGLVWLLAVLLAVPAQQVIAGSVQRLVSEGFNLQGAQGEPSSLPLSLWALILGGSLAIAIFSVCLTMRRIDTKRIAQTLRSPD